MEYELETLEDEFDAEDIPGRRTRLNRELKDPFRFVPLFGPDNVYNFFYATQFDATTVPIDIWYHDYHSCELLSDKPMFESFDEFGADLCRRIKARETLVL